MSTPNWRPCFRRPTVTAQHTVLIVDDSPEDRAIYSRFLERSSDPSFTCRQAATVAAVWPLLAAGLPDCLLIDQNLPDDDGLSLIKQLRTRYAPSAFAIVMITGGGSELLAVQAMKLGIQDYVMKDGLGAHELRRVVHNAIERVALERQIAAQQQAIADQVERERELRLQAEAARQQVVTILESITDGFFALDADWTITYINQTAERVLGRARSSTVGMNFFTAFPDLAGSIFAERYQHIQATQTAQTFEAFDELRQRWFEAHGYPLESGGLAIYLHDITERKRAEAALVRREHEYRTLVENAPDIITRFDRQLRHLYVSPAIKAVTTRTPADYVGKTNSELGMPPELCAVWDGAVQRVFERNEVVDFDFDFPSPDGLRSYVCCLVPERDHTGAVVTVMGLARDMTAQKRAARGLTFLSEASKALAESLDVQTTVAQVTALAVPSLGDWCGVALRDPAQQLEWVASTSVAERLTAPMQSLLLAEDSPLGPGCLRVLQTGHASLWTDVAAKLNGDGAELGLRSLIMVPLRARGEIFGMLSVATTQAGPQLDAYDLELVEELGLRAALAITNARLYQAAQEGIREREVFVSVASHELKNPLAGLIGRAQLLLRRARRDDNLNEHEIKDVHMIVHQARRVNALLNTLMDMSRLGLGQFSLHCAPLDLNRLVHSIVEELRVSSAKHTFVEHYDSAELLVYGDAVRLEQVVRNLLHNAVKYSPLFTTITIETALVDGQVCFYVRDEGPGIPAEAQPHIFERFYRVPEAEQSSTGSGIGLFVVAEIVKRHGGTVNVASDGEHGSTFSVCLPQQHEQQCDTENASAAVAEH